MFIFKFNMIICITILIFLSGYAESSDGLVKMLAKGVQHTVDTAIDAIDDNVGSGLVGNILKGAGAVAKDAIDGTERIVSEADDHVGDAARAAHHGLASMVKLGNETLKDIGSFVGDTVDGVKGAVSNTMWMTGNVTGEVRKWM